jgi:hypothetical protein
MQRERRHGSVRAFFERDLRIHHFHKELPVALGKEFESRLTRYLPERPWARVTVSETCGAN